MEELRKKVIEMFDMGSLPEEKQNELIDKIAPLVYQASLIRAMEAMTDEEVDALEKMLNADAKPEEIFGYLESHVENFNTILSEEAHSLKEKTENIMSKIG